MDDWKSLPCVFFDRVSSFFSTGFQPRCEGVLIWIQFDEEVE